MCGVDPVTLAIGALKVGTAVSGWQEQRQQASNQAYADYKTRANADQAYLNDLSKIETERGQAAREKGTEEFRAKLKRMKDLAKAQKVDLENISITKLADQFHEYITTEKNLNLEVASEYLLMATWLT